MVDVLNDWGEGEGQLAGRPVRVPLTLPGDRVTVRAERTAQGLRGEARAWRERVPRADPPCRHFGVCGGCRLQHLDAAAYRTWVGAKIERALHRQQLAAIDVRRPQVTPPGSRRRLRLGFVRAGGRIRLGLRALSSHRIVEIEECPIARPGIVALLEPLREALARVPADVGDVLISEARSGLDVLVIAPAAPDLEAREALARLADEQDLARLAWTLPKGVPEALAARRRVFVRFDDVDVTLPIGAFLQASADAEIMIRTAVMEALAASDRLVDLFAGCGTFALPLARAGRRVFAVDRDPTMIDALAAAAGEAGLAGRVTAAVRDLERAPLRPGELEGVAGAVLDPPRAGALAQVQALAGTAVEEVAMVSCNPSTFARDARVLVDAGFRADWVQPIDPFLWSAEVEVVGAFRRQT